MPDRKELCSIPIGDAQDLVKKGADAWIWDALEGIWSPIGRSVPVIPGAVIMLPSTDGRYTKEEGWDPRSKKPVPIVPIDKKSRGAQYSQDPVSVSRWETLQEHTGAVYRAMVDITDHLGMGNGYKNTLLDAVRWHDVGKAHGSFHAKIMQEERENHPLAAKAPKNAWRRDKLPARYDPSDGRRRHFRHDLASGLLTLMYGKPDLVAYLSAAHHGKVRLSIRSMPEEYRSPNREHFARGIWENDIMPPVDLGDGVWFRATPLDLSYMDLGEGPKGPSWLSRMLALRDSPEHGPFRLSYLEALMKAADERASGGRI
jgi:CRISPR-associated endonuclease/helicase Cas3